MDNKKLDLAQIIIGVIIVIGVIYSYDTSSDKHQETSHKKDDTVISSSNTVMPSQDTFNRNIQCQSLLSDIKSNNHFVSSIYYSSEVNTCVVKFRDNNFNYHQALIENMPSLVDIIRGNYNEYFGN